MEDVVCVVFKTYNVVENLSKVENCSKKSGIHPLNQDVSMKMNFTFTMIIEQKYIFSKYAFSIANKAIFFIKRIFFQNEIEQFNFKQAIKF